MRRILGRNFLVSAASLSVITSAFPALAQDESAMEGASSSGEIIVTARKREESILKVPVIVSALPKEQLETYQVTSLQDLPKLVPGLLLGHSLLSIGTLTSIRGVGPTSQDPGVDSSTSLNIDGLSLGNGLAFSSGMFDIGQVEVFKGPQALFYGKSSPAGVISLRTADPTDELEVIARASYEFVSKNPRGELIVSGPVSENLKLRLAAMYSTSRGYFRNKVTPTSGTGALAPPFSRAPRSEGYIIRGTALWEASDRFTARLKLNLVHDRARFAESFQVVSCPEGSGPVPGIGIPFLGGEDCKLDRNMHVVGVDPAVFPLVPNNGVPFLENDQYFGSLELSYDLTDSLNLSSTTGYYKLKSKSAVNASESQSAGSPIAYNNRFGRKQVTEEVRLNSDFAGALNLTLGAFFEDGRIVQNVTGLGNTLYGLPALLDQGRNPVNIKTYSLFGQGRIAITPQLELAAGLRWTDEKRTESPVNFGSPVTVLNPRLRSKNTVPEVTLTYTPTDNLTVFAAYKKAYKSGSFSMATSPRPNTDNSFSDEKVEGGEGGVKARLLDRQLNVNVAGYYYRYNDLQVGARTPAVQGVPRVTTVNAASARTYGIDFDAAYRPAGIEGLSLNGSIVWNKAKYLKFTNAPCYGGQLISDGCNQIFNPAANSFTAQDLSGTPMVRAPEWQLTFGFDYEIPVGDGYRLKFSNSNQYSSSFATALAANRPGRDNYQDKFAKVDLSLAFIAPDDRWEVALIGKNVTDKVTAGNCNVSNYAGGAVFPNPYGGTTRGPAGFDEVGCFAEPGREIWMRVTFRPAG